GVSYWEGPAGLRPFPNPSEDKQSMEQRLRKSNTDSVIFGVCGGLGRYFQVDPVLIRIGFVVLTLAALSGALIYIVMAIVMPADDGTEPDASADPDSAAPGRRREGLAALLIIGGVVILLANLGAFSWLDWSTLWPLALVGIGVLIIAQRYRR
ncbi:MAG: PspC domain-containing protein, partial [Dehalococcoidia bacterium]